MIVELPANADSAILAELCGGKAHGHCDIGSISIDSREISRNTLFIAVRGENTDGHKYIDGAIKNGAVCIMCDTLPEGFEGNYILVGDTVKAMEKIAANIREKLSPLTVAVTGSVGKTTTKEFISYVLGSVYPTLKSGGNFNTIYGVCLTLATLSPIHRAAVLEMGMSAKGEISRMTDVARPDIAVITNIGNAHLESLGSRENICAAKLEITEGLKDNGTLVYNGDEELLRRGTGNIKNCVSFGISNTDVDYFGYNIVQSGEKTVFDIKTPDGVAAGVELPCLGVHNVCNALAAFAVGRLAGISEENIRTGLACYRTTGMRQKIYKTHLCTVIEDCYNAGPESMKAALSVLSELGGTNRKIAVLGEMRELGKTSDALHKEVGDYAAHLKLDSLYTFGEAALGIAVGALEGGMDESAIVAFKNLDDPEGLAEILKKDLKADDVVLFKASRAIALERVIALLSQ